MINKELVVSKSIIITASPSEVWDALTQADKIKVYLFGTETITDWKVGSPIIFQGEYQGNEYKDKGNVIENKFKKLLKYNYWSGFSGVDDRLENYSIVTYILDLVDNNQTKLTWRQEGFATKEGQQHSENGLSGMLGQIKKLVENR